MRAKTILVGIVAVILVFSSANAFARPAIVDLVVDGTGSINDSDFNKQKIAIIEFIKALYVRSQLHPGELCDWLSVNFFGGRNEYRGSQFINCSDLRTLTQLAASVSSKSHPRYGSTAIYNAIGKALIEIRQHDEQLPTPSGTYTKVVIVVTDGDDTDSDSSIKQVIRQNMQQSGHLVIVVGVGSGFKSSVCQGIAHLCVPIKEYDTLAAALVVLLEQIP